MSIARVSARTVVLLGGDALRWPRQRRHGVQPGTSMIPALLG